MLREQVVNKLDIARVLHRHMERIHQIEGLQTAMPMLPMFVALRYFDRWNAATEGDLHLEDGGDKSRAE